MVGKRNDLEFVLGEKRIFDLSFLPLMQSLSKLATLIHVDFKSQF